MRTSDGLVLIYNGLWPIWHSGSYYCGFLYEQTVDFTPRYTVKLKYNYNSWYSSKLSNTGSLTNPQPIFQPVPSNKAKNSEDGVDSDTM